MKNVKRAVVFIMLAAMVLTGCGKKEDAREVQGAFENRGNTLVFADGKVTITEGNLSSVCDYEMDKEGNIVIVYEGEEIPAEYDSSEEVVIINNIKYRKMTDDTETENSSIMEEAESGSVMEEEEANIAVTGNGDYNKEMFSGRFQAFTEEGLLSLSIESPAEGGEGSITVITNPAVAQEKGESYEKIVTCAESYADGNTITWILDDGEKMIWTYDEEEETLKNGQYCFYRISNEEIKKKLIDSSEKTLEGEYSAIHKGAWKNLTYGCRKVRFTFNADHTASATIDEDRSFMSGEYFIKDGYFYFWPGDNDGFWAGTYDEETDTITYYQLELKKRTEEELQQAQDEARAEG